MSKKQIDMAVGMIEKAQAEMNLEYKIEEFKRLVEAEAQSTGSTNKEAQAIIKKLVNDTTPEGRDEN